MMDHLRAQVQTINILVTLKSLYERPHVWNKPLMTLNLQVYPKFHWDKEANMDTKEKLQQTAQKPWLAYMET